MKRDPWKLVTDEAELKVGMCVELRPCQACGRRERRILLNKGPAANTFHCYKTGKSEESISAYSWAAAGRCDQSFTRWQAGSAIRERRLYALIDDDSAADETTVTRRREMAK
jgi:hypothetical protein